jgi:hypothetical protein
MVATTFHLLTNNKSGEGGGRGREGTSKQSKSKEGARGLGSFPHQRGGLEVQELFQLGERGLTSRRN